jgi:hypothetical protein
VIGESDAAGEAGQVAQHGRRTRRVGSPHLDARARAHADRRAVERGPEAARRCEHLVTHGIVDRARDDLAVELGADAPAVSPSKVAAAAPIAA